MEACPEVSGGRNDCIDVRNSKLVTNEGYFVLRHEYISFPFIYSHCVEQVQPLHSSINLYVSMRE